ncbi:MAG: arylsulfatase [Candidatus Nealsonbacteria bacterium]|nr:arylsulfatase [Candidatus Nealsonbacteria bacterium]
MNSHRREKLTHVLYACCLAVAIVAAGSAPAAEDSPPKLSRPNIVILFVDDMGYSDVGCFGGEIETPNLDRLAAGGLRLTQFYNTSRCCPSRACLLTGLYPHQAGIGMMVYRDHGEGYRGNLNDRCVTFGEVLGTAGYQTMLVGKWHAGHEPRSRPEVRGFDRFTGIYPHIDSYWKVLRACDVYRDRKLLIPAAEDAVNPYHPQEEFYTTDFFTDVALDYIDQASRDKSKPMLLHVCYNVPHFPLEAPDALIDKYRGRYMAGWDKLREEKLERMNRMGIVGPEQKLPRVKGFVNEKIPGFTQVGVETDYLPKWDSLDEADRRELDFRRAIYAAQIDRFDFNVGRIVEHLKKREILDNTLILFFSDNGCSGEMDHFGSNWGKYTSANYREWRKKGGWSISQGQCWASYSNTPLRKYKKFVHEGGIASPMIAHWPAGIKRPGRICNQHPYHLVDVMPTLCEVAGAEYPATYDGREITPPAGISMVPLFTDTEAENQRRSLYWQHENHAAIRRGNWKLVTADDRKGAWDLYNLANDRSETADVALEHPEIAQGLKRLWLLWAHQIHVLPYPEDREPAKPVPWPPRAWGE